MKLKKEDKIIAISVSIMLLILTVSYFGLNYLLDGFSSDFQDVISPVRTISQYLFAFFLGGLVLLFIAFLKTQPEPKTKESKP